VRATKADIENDRAAAEQGLQGQAATLAQEIVRRVLQPAGVAR
jgi:F0F1-type ATP synthase membrane subunit b/b'